MRRAAFRLASVAAFLVAGSALASQSAFHERSASALLPVQRTSSRELAVPAAANDLCAGARIASLRFSKVDGITTGVDWCQVPVEQVPAVQRGTIERLGDLNARVADALGIPVAEAFGAGYAIDFEGSASGSIDSVASFRGVLLRVLPDWTLADFPSMVYAHEIIHTLAFNPGPVGQALRGVVDHPMISEAFPDLVSATVHDSRVIELGETAFFPALRNYRDAATIPSLDEPFRRFHYFASLQSIEDRCRGIDLAVVSKAAALICATAAKRRVDGLASTRTYREAHEVVATPFTDAELDREFRAEDCAYRLKNGMVVKDNCDDHQLALPLVTFFFRLREIAGRPLLADFMAALRRLDALTPAYECRYANASRSLGGASFDVRIRPILGAFVELREALPEADRAAFDRAWNDAGFSKLVDLDRLYRNEMLPAISQVVAKARNPAFAQTYGCTEVYELDPEQCRVECVPKSP